MLSQEFGRDGESRVWKSWVSKSLEEPWSWESEELEARNEIMLDKFKGLGMTK